MVHGGAANAPARRATAHRIACYWNHTLPGSWSADSNQTRPHSQTVRPSAIPDHPSPRLDGERQPPGRMSRLKPNESAANAWGAGGGPARELGTVVDDDLLRQARHLGGTIEDACDTLAAQRSFHLNGRRESAASICDCQHPYAAAGLERVADEVHRPQVVRLLGLRQSDARCMRPSFASLPIIMVSPSSR